MMDIGEKYIYITSEQEIWLIDDKEATSKVMGIEDNMGLISLGKTNYILLYSRDHAIRYDGNEYLIGEIIICKDEDGLKPLKLYEIMEAIDEFSSRLVDASFDGKPVQAFWV